MNYFNDHVLLHHAHYTLRERRADADRAALLTTARAGRSRFDALRSAGAHGLGRFARLLAAIAEDLDPATARARRTVPMAPRRG